MDCDIRKKTKQNIPENLGFNYLLTSNALITTDSNGDGIISIQAVYLCLLLIPDWENKEVGGAYFLSFEMEMHMVFRMKSQKTTTTKYPFIFIKYSIMKRNYYLE